MAKKKSRRPAARGSRARRTRDEEDRSAGGSDVGRTMARKRVSELGDTGRRESRARARAAEESGGTMARKPVAEARSLGAILAAKESMEDKLLRRPGVTGVDVGYKYVGGERTEQIAIRVLVANKRNVPAAQAVPETIDGIPTDVINARSSCTPTPAATHQCAGDQHRSMPRDRRIRVYRHPRRDRSRQRDRESDAPQQLSRDVRRQRLVGGRYDGAAESRRYR